MISAKEARALYEKPYEKHINRLLEYIERSIKEAASKGLKFIEIESINKIGSSLNCEPSYTVEDWRIIRQDIENQLTELGYAVRHCGFCTEISWVENDGRWRD